MPLSCSFCKYYFLYNNIVPHTALRREAQMPRKSLEEKITLAALFNNILILDVPNCGFMGCFALLSSVKPGVLYM